jgi:hypothetical protein
MKISEPARNILIGIAIVVCVILFINHRSEKSRSLKAQPVRNSNLQYSDNIPKNVETFDVETQPSNPVADQDYAKKMTTQNTAVQGKYKKASYIDGNRGAKSSELDKFFEEGNPFAEGTNDAFSPKDETNGNLAGYVPTNKPLTDEDKFNAGDLLPVETNKDWFDDVNATGIKNSHLINIYRPVGIATINSSLKNPSHDIRGTPPNPRNFVSPWLMSSYEPDMNIRNQSLCY